MKNLNLKTFRASEEKGLNQTRNPCGFQTEGANQTRNPFGFQNQQGLNQTCDPLGFLQTKPETPSGFRKAVKTKPETFSGFKRGDVNQTRNPFGFRVSEEKSLNQTWKPFRISRWEI